MPYITQEEKDNAKRIYDNVTVGEAYQCTGSIYHYGKGDVFVVHSIDHYYYAALLPNLTYVKAICVSDCGLKGFDEEYIGHSTKLSYTELTSNFVRISGNN